jgi:hypothetical protein
MSLQLTRTVADGIGRVFTRTGAILLAALLAIQLLVQASVNTAFVGLLPSEAAAEAESMVGLTLPIPGTVAAGLFVFGILLSTVYFVILSRALTRPRDALSTFPAELYTRRIGRATVSMFVGGVVVSFSVTLGLALLILPGVFLAACFLFFIFAVSVEDRGVVGALKRSWALSRGNRLRLAAVVFFAGAIGAVTGGAGSLLQLAGTPVVADLVSVVLNSVLFVVLYGIIAAAYLQVGGETRKEHGRSGTTHPLGGAGTPDR